MIQSTLLLVLECVHESGMQASYVRSPSNSSPLESRDLCAIDQANVLETRIAISDIQLCEGTTC